MSGLLPEFVHFHLPCGIFLQVLRGGGMQLVRQLHKVLEKVNGAYVTVDEVDHLLPKRPEGAALGQESSQCDPAP